MHLHLHFKLKHFLFSLVLIFLLAIALHYHFYNTRLIEEDVTEQVEVYLEAIRNPQNDVTIADYLHFESDGYYIFGPYTTSESREKVTGCPWTIEESYLQYVIGEWVWKGDFIPETSQVLIFMNEDKPVGYAQVDRSLGDFYGVSSGLMAVDAKWVSSQSKVGDQWEIGKAKTMSFDYEPYNPALKNMTKVNECTYEVPKEMSFLEMRLTSRTQNQRSFNTTVKIDLKGADTYTISLVDGNTVDQIETGSLVEWSILGVLTKNSSMTFNIKQQQKGSNQGLPKDNDYLLITTKHLESYSCEWYSTLIPLPGNSDNIFKGELYQSADVSSPDWFYQVMSPDAKVLEDPFDNHLNAIYSIILKTL